MYESLIIKEFPSKKTIKVMTWNIRFGAGRFPFFGDSCGEGVLEPDENVQNLEKSLSGLTPDLDKIHDFQISKFFQKALL